MNIVTDLIRKYKKEKENLINKSIKQKLYLQNKINSFYLSYIFDFLI